MHCLSNLSFVALLLIFFTQFNFTKCLRKLTDKLDPASNMESSKGPRNIFIISYGLKPQVIDNVLENEQIKALVTQSKQAMKIHLNNSKHINDLYNIVYRSKGERELSEKLNTKLVRGLLRRPSHEDKISYSSSSSSSSSSSWSVESRDDRFDKRFDDDEDDDGDDDDDNDGGEDDDDDIDEIPEGITNNDHLIANVLRFGSSCTKGAAKDCKKACKHALKDVCKDYRCRSGLKSRFKSECRKSCHDKFSGKE